MSRKIILIIVTAITVLSIFILGILAPEVSQTFITIKVTGIEIDKSDLEEVGTGDNLNMVVVLKNEDRTYQIKWKVLPVDENGFSTATNKNVTFNSNNPNISVSNEGLVRFPQDISKSMSTIVTITTVDGSYTDSITISYIYVNEVVVD
ncbi:hypothetical protein IKQ02_05165 [bacterium]|nr:hypothetical protein [bacterium]